MSDARISRRGQREHPPETGADAGLKVLIRYLVLSFPQATIFSRSVGERYHVCVIVPYDGSPEKAVQVERAVGGASARSIKAFEQFLAQLNLPRLFRTRDRCEVRSASRRQQEPGCAGHAGKARTIARKQPWPTVPPIWATGHSPFAGLASSV